MHNMNAKKEISSKGPRKKNPRRKIQENAQPDGGSTATSRRKGKERPAGEQAKRKREGADGSARNDAKHDKKIRATDNQV